MDYQIWSWILGAIGVTGFFLVGKKLWWAWYINIANQVVWVAYSVITQQWGFLVVTFVYFFVFCKNAYRWTKDHFAEKEKQTPGGIGNMGLHFTVASQEAEQRLRNMFRERTADANPRNRK